MKLALFLLAFFLSSSLVLGTTYAEKLSTEKGTLDVNLVVEISEDNPMQSKLKIDFLNPVTGNVQEHIDYIITIFDKSEKLVFGPIPVTHTSVGTVTIPVEIDQSMEHRVIVKVLGILFQPIEKEAVVFTIGGAAAIEPEKVGGCLIATAAYGSELAPQVQQLRHVRDTILQTSDAGSSFMTSFNTVYYAFSPTVADFERENEFFRDIVRAYITPMISTLSIMENADSEAEIVSYGIGIILLNTLLYIIIPVIMTTLLYKKISKLVPKTRFYAPKSA